MCKTYGCSGQLTGDRPLTRSETRQQTGTPRSQSITMQYHQHLISTMTRQLYHWQPLQEAQGGRQHNHRHSKCVNRNFQRASHSNRSSMVWPLLLISAVSLAAVSLPASASSNAAAASQAAQQMSAQARVGGLDPSDYIDEAGELEIMALQQQIPTGQLMSAAGHLVPDNFFVPGTSIPAAPYLQQLAQQRYLQAQQVQHAQQQQVEQLTQAASQLQPRVVAAPARYGGQRALAAPLDLLMAAAAEQQQQSQQAPQQHQDQASDSQHNQNQIASLIDFNGYNLAARPDLRDAVAQVDLVEFLSSPTPVSQAQLAAALHEQQLHQHQHQQQQQSAGNDQQQQHANLLAEQLTALASNQHEAGVDAANDQHYQMGASIGSAMIGPDYQLVSSDQYQQASSSHGGYESKDNGGQGGQREPHQSQRPYGLPTKSSSKEPPGMLKPLGNPKTVSSPAIDFVANNLPKTSSLQALADKLPAHQTPTAFSFASSKDPTEKVKAVNQKKRNVMRQAEQMAKMLIKSINDKFGTTLGDQSDIPFLLSSLGPLGFAQNVLLDPTLLVTLLNSVEKTYFSDVLPGPAKSAIKPVLNLFRVPNKKRDKANLLNIISYLASGGQTSSSVPSKHRQSFGIEKASASSSKSTRIKDTSRR